MPTLRTDSAYLTNEFMACPRHPQTSIIQGMVMSTHGFLSMSLDVNEQLPHVKFRHPGPLYIGEDINN